MENLEVIKILNKVVCDNQLMLSQYFFVANEKHKKLKTIFSKPEKYQYKDLGESYIQLDEYLYEEFGVAFDKNIKRLFNFFNLRNPIQPRGCIKIIIAEEIVTLYRYPRCLESMIQDRPFKYTENTAFVDIAKGESYFLSNDIPNDVKNDKYKNGRIDKNKVLQYLQPNNNLEWSSCWNKIKILENGNDKFVFPPLESCYKSTMVIPMSLKTEDLVDEFKNHFALTNISEQKERVIFGFLCLDHQETNFFKPDVDVPVAYIFADLLSLYLICQLTHTEYSEVYRRAKKSLDNYLNNQRT